jgi:hypothetical protein
MSTEGINDISVFVTRKQTDVDERFGRVLPGIASTGDTRRERTTWHVDIAGAPQVILQKSPFTGPHTFSKFTITEVVGSNYVSSLFIAAPLDDANRTIAWANRLDIDGGEVTEWGENAYRLDDIPAEFGDVIEQITGDPIDGFVMFERS